MDNVPYGDLRFELRSGDYLLTIIPECAYISYKGKAQKIDHAELLKRLWHHSDNGWLNRALNEGDGVYRP
jgi:hypothetical protein